MIHVRVVQVKNIRSAVENNNPEKEIGKSNENLQEKSDFEPANKKESNLAFIFFHKLGEKLSMAWDLNSRIKILRSGERAGFMIDGKISQLSKELQSENIEDIIKDKIEQINASKQLFRDFLEMIIDGRQPIPVSSSLTVEKVKEAYEKSDFDWTNQLELKKFNDWFSN